MAIIIAIDGADYSGKSTLAAALTELIKTQRKDKTKVKVQNFPSMYPWGILAREALVKGDAEKFTHYVVKDFIQFSELLNNGVIDSDVIILDRYIISTYAHQNHTVNLETAGVAIPDLYLVFDTKYETMVERTNLAGLGWDEKETAKYRTEDKWATLNSRYITGLEHYKDGLKTTMVSDAESDKELLAQTIYQSLMPLFTKL